MLLCHLPKSSLTSNCSSLQLKKKRQGVQGLGSSQRRSPWVWQELQSTFPNTCAHTSICVLAAPRPILYFTTCLLWFMPSLPPLQCPKSFPSFKTRRILSKKSSMLTPVEHDCYLIMYLQDIFTYVPFIWYSSFAALHSLFMCPCLIFPIYYTLCEAT